MHIIYVVNLPLHLMFYIFFRCKKKDTAPKKQQPGGEKSNTEATGRSDIQALQKQKRNLQSTRWLSVMFQDIFWEMPIMKQVF